ncbi:hypothetical protein ACN47E_003923 [Coniothyrium glycines]
MSIFQARNDVESRLCTAVNAAIRAKDARQLQAILILEPEYPPEHQELISALRTRYPSNDGNAEQRLEQAVRRTVTETGESEDEEGRPVQAWGSMVTFLVGWMTFLRDVDLGDYLKLYSQLSDLQQQANSALQHPVKGILMLPTIIDYANIFIRVVVGLDKQPELIEHLIAEAVDEEGQRESLPEKAANTVRHAFITCLNDRNTAPGGVRDGRPDGKKVGIYKMANICLKLLLQADKPESCETIFKNIMNSSPPLHIYPAAERVTYLYYLGRYHFANGNFYAAQLVLEKAYADCHSASAFVKQRRLILVYLIAANLILGRFPSEAIYSTPEAKGFRQIFGPIAQAIRRGDLAAFRKITNLDLTHPCANFLVRYRIFYQIGNYCEVLVWRSLFRKIFILTGAMGSEAKSAAVLDLNAVLHIFRYLESRASTTNGGFAFGGHLVSSNNSSAYIDPDFAGMKDIEPYHHQTDLMEIESICGSLITQGLLLGYISQKSQRVAVSGARRPEGALAYGFPQPWQVIQDKSKGDVLGWKKEGGSDTQGQVVRLSGARPAGS